MNMVIRSKLEYILRYNHMLEPNDADIGYFISVCYKLLKFMDLNILNKYLNNYINCKYGWKIHDRRIEDSTHTLIDSIYETLKRQYYGDGTACNDDLVCMNGSNSIKVSLEIKTKVIQNISNDEKIWS